MTKILGVLLVVAGALALVYRGVTLPGEKKGVQLGSVELSVQKQERYEIPVWAGVAAAGVGVALLLAGARRER
jgi:hypothetical protein